MNARTELLKTVNQVANPKDRLARVVAIAAFIVSILTFYFAFLRPACVRVGLGPQVFIASKPRIGVLATLVNDGARQIVITSGELALDKGRFTLPLTTAAIQTESWEYDDVGNRQAVNPFRFSDFTPFALKPHDQISASFWFVATQGFPLVAGRHAVTITIEDSKHHQILVSFEIELTQADIEALYKKEKGNEQAGIEYPITIVSQQGGEYCPVF